MLKELRNYILENEFKINIIKNKVDIINYKEIEHFDDEKIIIRSNEGYVTVKGKKLIISKLLDDEVLINGEIKNIEFK